MFRLERLGYSRIDVEEYLEQTLKRLENFERIISLQQEEINSLKLALSDTTKQEEIIAKAKENADDIIYGCLEEMNHLERRVHKAILSELDK